MFLWALNETQKYNPRLIGQVSTAFPGELALHKLKRRQLSILTHFTLRYTNGPIDLKMKIRLLSLGMSHM